MSAPQRTPTTHHVVAAAGEIAPGECKIMTVAGRSIGVFNVGGEYLLTKCNRPRELDVG